MVVIIRARPNAQNIVRVALLSVVEAIRETRAADSQLLRYTSLRNPWMTSACLRPSSASPIE